MEGNWFCSLFFAYVRICFSSHRMQSGQNPSVGSRVIRLGGKLGLLRADLEGRQAEGFWSPADGTTYQCVRACCSCVGAVVFGWQVGKEMSWVMKTIVMEKGRGDWE